MTDARPNTDEVLQQLAARGDVAADELRRAQSWANDAAREVATPPYLQPFIFLGALLAAVMITAGIAAGLDLRWEGPELLTMGLIYLAAGVVSHVSRTNDFTDHLGLALSIGGHGFLLAGIDGVVENEHPEMTLFFASVVLGAALYGLYRDSLHRFLSCLLVFVIAKFAFPAEGLTDALHGFVAAMVAACIALLTRERQSPTWRPLAYACGYGLPLLLLPLSSRGMWFDDPDLPRRQISSVVLGLGMLWVLRFAVAEIGIRTSRLAQLVAVVVIAGLCAFGEPGILAALFLIVLGYSAHHGQLAVVGLVALPVFVFKYYYSLDLDFMAKSGVLAGSGALLLLARWAFSRGQWFAVEAEVDA